MKLFLAHNRNVPEETLTAWKAKLAVDSGAEVVLGRDDFMTNAARYGGWDGWARGISGRKEYGAEERTFAAIVIPRESPGAVRVGKATAIMVDEATTATQAVPVLLWDVATGKMEKATSGRCVDDQDFKAGWEVQ